MDALSLVSPANVVVNPGANGGDANCTDPSKPDATVDFAALLAAGMLPPQPPVDAAIKPAAAEGDGDDAQALQAALKNGTDNAGVPLHTALALQAAAAKEGVDQAAAKANGERHLTLDEMATANAPLAADAASFAARAAAHALGMEAARDTKLTEARIGAEAGAASADLSAIAAQSLNAAALEKAPQPQPVAHLQVTAPIDTPDFAQSLSQQVVWMVDKDAQVAELRINPPELGPVEVRLTLSGDQAAVQFTSTHAEVRNVLESAIGRLRETMADAGIALGQTSVSAESFRDQGAGQFDGRERRGDSRGERGGVEPAWSPAPSVRAVRRGLVDLFA